jgi:hypothetical protein
VIYFLVSKYHKKPIREFLETTGKQMPGLVRPVIYNRFVRWRSPPPGTYVFADIDRTSPRLAERLAPVWQRMAEEPDRYRLLNHPIRTLDRFALLRRLHAAGLNDFTVYRADEAPRPARFPVFIRREDDHAGARSDLIPDQASLEEALAGMVADGISLRDKIVTELCAEADERGLYRKYGVIVIGDAMIANQCHFARTWMIKRPQVIDDETIAHEIEIFYNPPHVPHLREVLRQAYVQFGRIDYGVVGGRPQIYEINTNPTLAVSRNRDIPAARAEITLRALANLAEAWRKIDTGPAPGLFRVWRERIR